MPQYEAANGDVRVSCLSQRSSSTSWSIAVFAHNEAGCIRNALASIAAATAGQDITVYVLANGCTDSTADEVRASTALLENLWLVEIDTPGKANAWNVYIHDIFTREKSGDFETFFFMDGDVTLAPDALPLLAAALAEVPSAEAAGGMPITGRDCEEWRQRMVINGMLAGNYYALRDSFVHYLRERQVRMPIGLIGDDFLISWLLLNRAWRDEIPDEDSPRLLFHSQAEFSFPSLSPWRLSNYRIYLNRKWRYTLRGIQHQMLLSLLTDHGLSAMPRNVDELYRTGLIPSRLSWVGHDALLHIAAVQWIRLRRWLSEYTGDS